MATTPNYGWVTPAPTDFVTDLPADFETFADAVDADLAGLLGGTTGQVLTKDSATDHDFSWQAISAPTKDWVLINTGGTTLSGSASVQVTGLDDYNDIVVGIYNASSASASSQLKLSYNNANQTMSLNENRIIAGGTLDIGTNDSTSSQINLANMSNNAASTFMGTVFIWGGTSSTVKPYLGIGGAEAGGGSGHRHKIQAGVITTGGAITSVTAISDTGNFDKGSIYVWGTV